jgi:hypothetical protein
MKNWLSVSALAFAAWAAASASFAGGLPPPVGAPAPLLGAGISGLVVLGITGAGYVAMRLRRRGRD